MMKSMILISPQLISPSLNITLTTCPPSVSQEKFSTVHSSMVIILTLALLRKNKASSQKGGKLTMLVMDNISVTQFLKESLSPSMPYSQKECKEITSSNFILSTLWMMIQTLSEQRNLSTQKLHKRTSRLFTSQEFMLDPLE